MTFNASWNTKAKLLSQLSQICHRQERMMMLSCGGGGRRFLVSPNRTWSVGRPILAPLSTNVSSSITTCRWLSLGPHHQHHDPWEIRIPPRGTGFDNFLPKQDKNRSSSSNEKQTDNNNNKTKAESDASRKDRSRSSSSSSSGGGGGGFNNNNNINLQWTAVGILLALALYMSSGGSQESDLTDPDTRTSRASAAGAAGSNGGVGAAGLDREISWHDFLRLLQQQDVLKVLVTEERQLARVYLKPNATGLAMNYYSSRGGLSSFPSNTSSTSSSSSSSSGNNSNTYEERRRQQQQFVTSSLEQPHDVVDGLSHSGLDQQHHSGTASTAPMYYRMQIGSVEGFERKLDEAQRALGRDPTYDVPVQYASDSSLARDVITIIPGIVLAVMMYGMLRMAGGALGGGGFGGVGGGGSGGRGGMGSIFQIGKSTHKKINKEEVQITFKDVAGCDEAKKEIMEFVDFLKDPDRFTKLGAKIPKGALLCGPPGTGKTLLAKAVAGETGVPFYSISGSDFIEMFVGVGPSRVRDLFAEARANAPCIIFIDEIDAVGRQRGRGGLGGNDERENTLNQLLVEMDGFEPSTGVVVLAGTNRVDILDQALTRPGRFDRQITVDKPDLKGRRAIFHVHLKGITLEDSVDDIAGRLAGLTPGFSGADIANLCNEAAIVAARRKAESVSMSDFEKATDRIIGGLESNKIMSKEERGIVALHEAGHAVAGWFLEHADPLLKVTIIPRSSGALGFAQYLPKEVFLRSQDQIMDIVCMTLAGRAAEEIFFGRVTTGASDDLKRVTELVYSTIQLYGMNSRLGQLSFPRDRNAFFEERPYSEKTAKAMDEEARTIVDHAYQRTLNLLRERRSQVELVANMLLEKETITHDDILQLIGPRPFKGDPAYEEFVQRKTKSKDEPEPQRPQEDEEEGAAKPSAPGDLSPGLA